MRILVIEDEPELAHVIARAFREEEYAVDEAADGEAGLSKATTWDYDAIIMDVMLPKHDGWWVLMHLRRTHKTPVLMLTACDTVDDKVKGLDLGADDYLVKPFDLMELLARVRALIRRAADQPNPIIAIQDIRIDTGAKQVMVGGRLVVMTAREYAILELLARNRGRVVTRTQIYDHIFDETDDTFSNIVEVHVSNVRKKLGHDIIVTRRGLGYLIDA
jgi:two-component system, OmpR family, response regulator